MKMKLIFVKHYVLLLLLLLLLCFLNKAILLCIKNKLKGGYGLGVKFSNYLRFQKLGERPWWPGPRMIAEAVERMSCWFVMISRWIFKNR